LKQQSADRHFVATPELIIWIPGKFVLPLLNAACLDESLQRPYYLA
jgi:hypothetical protein